MKNNNYEKHINALSKISRAIASDLYLDDILKLIVTITAQLIGSNICSISLLNEKGDKLIIKATQSISNEYNKKPPLSVGEGIAGKVVKLNQPIAVKDVTREKEYKYHDIAKKEGLCSLLCAPLAVKGKVIGVINCYTSKPYEFTKMDIDIITYIANQAAVAIENTELMVKTKVIQEELESRKKIERAKGILMKNENMGEEEAYMMLQKYSMDRRKSMREVSEAIIISEEMRKAIK